MGAGKRLLTGESLFATKSLSPREQQAPLWRLFGAPCRQDHPCPSQDMGGEAHRAEGFVPVRGQGRQHRHRVQQTSAPDSSGGKASSCSACGRRLDLHSHASGTIMERTLNPEVLRVDTGCIVVPARPSSTIFGKNRRRISRRSSAAKDSSSLHAHKPRQDLAAVAAAQPWRSRTSSQRCLAWRAVDARKDRILLRA
jgi:hypothetical protein